MSRSFENKPLGFTKPQCISMQNIPKDSWSENLEESSEWGQECSFNRHKVYILNNQIIKKLLDWWFSAASP